ncbi:MAG: SDR family NAD(P)-dependent oxidoreductase [Anaerolineae bacterium]|nr:SDR family NAD(P)-dependent oxidoreductase [Anaerolineae bacterium]
MRKQPNSETVFLVSGGAKGITAQCVIALAERYHCMFILVGRSVYTEEADPVWATNFEDKVDLKRGAMQHLQAIGERPTPQRVQQMVHDVCVQREISLTLRAIKTAGGRAIYISADVTDVAALQAGVAGAVIHLGPVTGIIHGAGVLADKLIQHKTAMDFERVVGVKVQGLENLLACVPLAQLSYLVFFSSVAGFYGNVGQADYAIANEILNKVAHRVQRQYPACRVLAVDWGPWDRGMVTPELKRLLSERNVPMIPVEVGTAILADTLIEREIRPQIVVGGPMEPPSAELDAELRVYRVWRTLSLEANPFLRDHVIGRHAVLPTVCAVAWAVNVCEQMYPGYRFFCAENYKVLKGIVFDETLASAYVLELQELAKGAGQIIFDVLISSETEAGIPRYHYSVQITLRRELPAAPVYASVNYTETHTLDGSKLYTRMSASALSASASILFHGPSFQGVDRVLNLSLRGLTMRCVLPAISSEQQGQFPVQTFNPYLTDVQLQSLLIWAGHFYQMGGLPLRIQKGEQYRPACFDEVTYASLEVREHSARKLVADVTVHDVEGRIYNRVIGAEITLSARLKELFKQNEL